MERPSCKGCGSSEWNFEGVNADEQSFLARAQANASSRAKAMNKMEGTDEPGDQVRFHHLLALLAAWMCVNAQWNVRCFLPLSRACSQHPQVVVGELPTALNALNAAFDQHAASSGAGRTYEFRGVHFGSGVAAGEHISTPCALNNTRAHQILTLLLMTQERLEMTSS